MTVITMSRKELTRLRVLIDVADGRLSVADATGLVGVGRRQVYRLLQAFRTEWSGRFDFAETRRSEQPRSGCSVPRDGPGYRARALFRFWSDPDGREAVRGSRPGSRRRDAAAMDDRGRPLGSPKGPAEAHPSTANAA